MKLTVWSTTLNSQYFFCTFKYFKVPTALNDSIYYDLMMNFDEEEEYKNMSSTRQFHSFITEKHYIIAIFLLSCFFIVKNIIGKMCLAFVIIILLGCSFNLHVSSVSMSIRQSILFFGCVVLIILVFFYKRKTPE